MIHDPRVAATLTLRFHLYEDGRWAHSHFMARIRE